MSQPSIQPYLFFGGRCEEAIQFYQSTLGAEVEMMMRFSESPDTPPPGMDNRIMHASFRIGTSVIMASDGCEAEPAFEGFSLSLDLPDEAEVRRVFDLLSEGGEVTMAPDKTFWSPCFGMLKDRFGIGWMLSVAAEDQG